MSADPRKRLRRALLDAAEALADLFEEEAPAVPAKPPVALANNEVAERFARDQLERRGWPQPARRKKAG